MIPLALMDTATALPDWLTAPAPPAEDALARKRLARSLLHTQFQNFFETMLDQVALGASIASVVRNDRREFEQAEFLRWVYRDPERKRLLREAQEIGAEVQASEVVDIADTELDSRTADSRIAARKWSAQVQNRPRFGDVKQIDVNQNINLRGALAAAQGRLERVIEGEVVQAIEDMSSD